ncbi:hypothetical protein F3Y22_tig00110652pilonHSYRG00138 [Hibiscus syriacus]|uniref:Uncharacterized protein n=1 Tax=Hibiscus syriacus TaxID=106335 RepID=A0A6A3A006_HIBSY|nr:hypothetical protein F3Y22_tig00110652pilonHSYRG00138 [Hibiscus syriacus]
MLRNIDLGNGILSSMNCVVFLLEAELALHEFLRQSLRDKLRVQQVEDFPNTLNPDFIQVQSVRNDHVLLDPDELQTSQEHRQMLAEESSFSGYASGLAGRESNQDPRFVEEVMSNKARASSISAATQHLKPSYGNLQFVSPSLYQNAQQDFLTTASIGTQELEVASHEHQNVREADRCSRVNFCGNQANPLQCGDAGAWMNRPLVEHSQQWCGELGVFGMQDADDVQFTEDEYGYDGLHSRPGEFKELQDSKTLNLGNFCSMQKPSLAGKANGKSLQDTGGTSTNYVHRQTIPLAPLLDMQIFLRIQGVSSDAIGSDSAGADMEAGTSKGNSSGGLSSSFYSSNESCRPDYQQKKAKLAYMQQECFGWHVAFSVRVAVVKACRSTPTPNNSSQ